MFEAVKQEVQKNKIKGFIMMGELPFVQSGSKMASFLGGEF